MIDDSQWHRDMGDPEDSYAQAHEINSNYDKPHL